MPHFTYFFLDQVLGLGSKECLRLGIAQFHQTSGSISSDVFAGKGWVTPWFVGQELVGGLFPES